MIYLPLDTHRLDFMPKVHTSYPIWPPCDKGEFDFFFRENSRSTSKRGTTAVPPTGSLSGPFFGPLMDPCWPHIISPHLLPGSHVPAFSPQILPVCSLQRIHSKNELKPPTGYVRFSDHDLVIISETELFRTQLSTR